MKKIILFNPRSVNGKHRIPNSILQVGASINGKFDYIFIDGNLETDPWGRIETLLKTGEIKYFCSTVMPGHQLRQAIPYSKKIKQNFPSIINIWGGYFASNQYKTSLISGYVDYIINEPGDVAFPALLEALEANDFANLPQIKNVIYINHEGKIIKTAIEALLDQDSLPKLPYEYLNQNYSLPQYLVKTFLGKSTLAYHSSMGCPSSCSFCAVVPIFHAKWKGMSSQRIYEDVSYFIKNYGIDAIEFHDNNFFTSKRRVLEFSELILNDNISYCGKGRIDTINLYSDDELRLMRRAGCKMIFLGAETGNDAVLKQMNKGGTQTGHMIKDFGLRMKNVDIIPELSFVLGMPATTEKEVYDNILWDTNFIKEIKQINPKAEIIIYIFSPVPTEGSKLYEQILSAGFSFPNQLEDWISPSWENFDLQKNQLTPWLKAYMINTIRNFEIVLNGYYPTVSDFRIKGFKKKLMQSLAAFRYKTGFYKYPYELKVMQKILKYSQPEVEGFYSE